MKIGSVNNPIINQYKNIKVEAASQPFKAEPATDRVELSHEAMLFSEAFAAARRSMQEADPTQGLKVGQIMERMREGTYHVEAKDICDKLLV